MKKKKHHKNKSFSKPFPARRGQVNVKQLGTRNFRINLCQSTANKNKTAENCATATHIRCLTHTHTLRYTCVCVYVSMFVRTMKAVTNGTPPTPPAPQHQCEKQQSLRKVFISSFVHRLRFFFFSSTRGRRFFTYVGSVIALLWSMSFLLCVSLFAYVAGTHLGGVWRVFFLLSFFRSLCSTVAAAGQPRQC